MLSDIQVFIQVVESNGFAKAARVLKMSTASVTRKVAKLEKELEVTLLNRNTRKFSLTDYGEYCYKQCQNIPGILADLRGTLTNKFNEPSGSLNLSVSVYSGYMELIPIISEFLREYPKITIQFIKSNIFPDLIDESYDIYFRYKEINTRTLQAQKLIDHQIICCTTPDYIKSHGKPLKPADLALHNCIIHQINLYEGDYWNFSYLNKNTSIQVTGNLRLNNSILVLESALQGIGIARLPSYFFQKHIENGELVEVLNEYKPPQLPVWLIHPRPGYMSRKQRLFVDFILNAYKTRAST